MTTVDIVIAARNEEPSLAKCLVSLRAQDYPRDLTRLIVADNGSTDGTARVARELGAQVIAEPRPGAAAARNRGVSAGSGELVGFLDAHCVVEPNWVGSLATRFARADVGGCQARIVNRAVDARVQSHLDTTGELSNERILEDTIDGRRNLYPWVLSGNSMYRRQALQRAGLFDAAFEACEDVDLAWRVLLLGYRLEYCPEAGAVHHETRPLREFIRKGYRYGRGAAQLAWAYREHGSKRLGPKLMLSRTPRKKLQQALYYWWGYGWKKLLMQVGLNRPPQIRALSPVGQDFRNPFAWNDETTMSVSRYVVSWTCADEESVIVHFPRKQRYTFEGVGSFLWQRLAQGESRRRIVERVSARYGVAAKTAEADLDDLVESLVHEEIVITARSVHTA